MDEGCFVIGTFFQHQERLQTLVSPNFQGKQVDLRNPNSVTELAGSIKDSGLSLFAVINCAGICQFEGADIQSDFNILQDTIATNLSGNFYLAKIFYDLISENGRLILISSTDSFYGGDITASYAASKAGVSSLVKSFSILFKEKKIRVNAIAPGWVETPMIAGNGADFLQKVADINPLKRNAQPADVANLISFLLSAKADYLNGQVIPFEGGYTNQDPTLLIESEGQK